MANSVRSGKTFGPFRFFRDFRHHAHPLKRSPLRPTFSIHADHLSFRPCAATTSFNPPPAFFGGEQSRRTSPASSPLNESLQQELLILSLTKAGRWGPGPAQDKGHVCMASPRDETRAIPVRCRQIQHTLMRFFEHYRKPAIPSDQVGQAYRCKRCRPDARILS